MVVTAAMMGLAALLSYNVPGWEKDPGGIVFSIGLAALAAFGFTNLIRRNIQLAEARDELARLAVNAERERFARDLHDVLGHSLTVITVKSELAKRLVSRDPARAEAEVADIERLAREALADVRATVAGYREANLAREISTARQALEAAGIEADLPHALDAVEGERREAYAWVVREGITNVLRHSGARHVLVRVDRDCVEVRDDGRGGGDEAFGGDGNGLTGLSERIAAAGGRLHAGSLTEGGFRLAAEFGQPA
jgi:two-component system sensor histidine kinase DesK